MDEDCVTLPDGRCISTGQCMHSPREDSLEQVIHERDLLAQALGKVLVSLGVVRETNLTGPELLMAAGDVINRQDQLTADPTTLPSGTPIGDMYP